MTVYAINTNTLQCRPFATEKEMSSCGNVWHGFRSAEDLESKMVGLGLTITKMATIYNKVSEKEVKKFADKKTAAKRVFNAIADQVATIDEIVKKPKTPQIDFSLLKTSKFPVAPQSTIYDKVVENLKGTPEGDLISATAKIANPRGQFAGKWVRRLVSENPRREGTWGWKSFEILIRHGADMPYESYIESGGRRQDLAWDINKGFAEVYDGV
jgi:hypothetical protein